MSGAVSLHYQTIGERRIRTTYIMNTFFIKFRPSSTARNAALVQGKVLPEKITIEVDPSALQKEERELILLIGSPVAGDTLELNHNDLPNGEDLAAVLNLLSSKRDFQSAQEERRRIEHEEEMARRIENARLYLAGEEAYGFYPSAPATGDDEMNKAVLAEYTRRQATEQAKRDAQAAAEQANVDSLKSWALSHGSEHLKDLISMGFNWQKEAHNEWISANTPDGYEDIAEAVGYEESYLVKNPSPIAISALKQAISSGHDARLLRVKFDDDTHADYISIWLTPPAGEKVSVEKFIEFYTPK